MTILCLAATAAVSAHADDLVVWRPGSGTWYSLSPSGTRPSAAEWGKGSVGDVPVFADIDGDGVNDLIVWRAPTGTWYWLTSSSGYSPAAAGTQQFGDQSLGDVPLAGDIDGDGKADLVVWRESTGTWRWLTSSSGFTTQGSKQWGSDGLGDVPLLADIDGDGRADLVIWRGTTGTWYWLTAATAFDYAQSGQRQWGTAALGDRPLVGDIDGDGRADLIVWRASTGTWYWLTSSSQYDYAAARSKQWGDQSLGDVPIAADFDGDGRADLVVWRASTGMWFWLRSSANYAYASEGMLVWGTAGDVPFTGRSSNLNGAPPTPPTNSTAVTLRVLQWNTHHGGYGTDNVYDPDRLATWTASFNPDVVMFNEIEKNDSWGNQDQPAVYAALLQQKTGKTWYYVFAQEFGEWSSNGKGNLILSIYPIAISDRYELVHNGDRSIAMAEITVNNRNITLMSTHLDPYDATLRLTQATEVTAWAAAQPENRIIAGDMNAWPDQSSIAQFDSLYVDSWAVSAANGTAVAFAGNTGETKSGRIDYIFYSQNSPDLVVRSSQVFDTRDSSGVTPSDHRPVLTTFVVR